MLIAANPLRAGLFIKGGGLRVGIKEEADVDVVVFRYVVVEAGVVVVLGAIEVEWWVGICGVDVFGALDVDTLVLFCGGIVVIVDVVVALNDGGLELVLLDLPVTFVCSINACVFTSIESINSAQLLFDIPRLFPPIRDKLLTVTAGPVNIGTWWFGKLCLWSMGSKLSLAIAATVDPSKR